MAFLPSLITLLLSPKASFADSALNSGMPAIGRYSKFAPGVLMIFCCAFLYKQVCCERLHFMIALNERSMMLAMERQKSICAAGKLALRLAIPRVCPPTTESSVG